MSGRWKLIYDDQCWKIHNEQGKELTYDPNSGIQILCQDGYAFKDLNRNGTLDPFEDWRLPLKQRVQDFSSRYQVCQIKDALVYKKGIVTLSQSLFYDMECVNALSELAQNDASYLRDHYLLVLLILMFDHDVSGYTGDYIIQLFVESLEAGLSEQIFYTIKAAMIKYMKQKEQGEQLSLRL